MSGFELAQYRTSKRERLGAEHPHVPQCQARNAGCILQQPHRSQSKILDQGSKINCMHGRPTVKKQEQKRTQQKTYEASPRPGFLGGDTARTSRCKSMFGKKGVTGSHDGVQGHSIQIQGETVPCPWHRSGSCLEPQLTSGGQAGSREARRSEKGAEDEVAVFL